MATTTNIIILMFLLSFALYLGMPSHPETLVIKMISGRFLIFSETTNLIYLAFMALLGVGAVLGAATVLLGSFSFPNQYLIFGGLALLLLSFVTLPVDLLFSTEMPMDIKFFVGGTFGLMYLLTLISWFKGQTE